MKEIFLLLLPQEKLKVILSIFHNSVAIMMQNNGNTNHIAVGKVAS
jgi:hypothetical protein